MTDQSLNIPGPSPVSRNTRTGSPFDLAGALQRTWQVLAHLLRRRRDRAHLAELPDYLLEDIGLTRADVPGVSPVGETLC